MHALGNAAVQTADLHPFVIELTGKLGCAFE